MSETIQKRRRADRIKDRVATVAVAAALALLFAATLEALLLVIGLFFFGDPNWHREWLEKRLIKSVEWAEGAPVVGPAVSFVLDPQRGWLPRPGAFRDIVLLAIMLLAPSLVPAAHIGPVLVARYDDEALRPAPAADFGLSWAGPLGTVQQCVWAKLVTWCHAGTGDGRSPFWRPWVLPDVPERFTVAAMVGENGGGKSHLAEALARQLDRNDELAQQAARSHLAAWRLKLAAKWHELWWWRVRHPRQPWDCGYLVEDPAALLRLSQFRPRRPTLIVADELRAETLDKAVQALAAGRVDFRHPVRLLIVDVALPAILGLRFDAAASQWRTAVHELGTVPVIDFSGARFQVAQLRSLVGAQPPFADGKPSHLMGRDAEWVPVTTALDEQPILVAEALRWVRQERRSYEDLQRGAELPHLAEAMVARQAERSTPVLQPDTLGKRRELLRERVLRERACHREEGLRQALGGDAGDMAYHALMVATVAGGGSCARLARLLALPSNPLTSQRLRAAFGQALPADWVPPVKPSIVADELLRLHFDAPPDATLDPDTQRRVREVLRQAWLLNPSGARSTVARWQARRVRDAFTEAMCVLPTLADLQASIDPGLRVELTRAFVELAVLHGGELEPARAAMRSLQPSEWSHLHEAVRAILLNPDARGVPALLLWLDLQRYMFPRAGTLNPEQAEALCVRLAQEALNLLRQCVVVSVPVDAALERALDEAAFAALPLLSRFGDVLASSEAFGALAYQLEQRKIGFGREGALGQPSRIRSRVRAGLLAAMMGSRSDAASARGWARWVLSALPHLDSDAVVPALDNVQGPSLSDGAGSLSGLAEREWAISTTRALRFWSQCQDRPAQVLAGVQRLTNLTDSYIGDAAVQHEAAQAWRLLGKVHQDLDAQATAQAAQKVADIAARFERNEAIQREAAEAWCSLAWAHKDTDASATAQVARKVADIAARFERNEEIQLEATVAWRLLAWVYKDRDAQATAQAAQKVADIASRFERHEGIQFEAAAAWGILAWAHHDRDAQATAHASQKVADIAARFARHEDIQLCAAGTWSALSRAHAYSDTQATAQAAQQVADIAARFEQNEAIQLAAAQAWRNLAWAYKDSDAQATAEVVQKVADIAALFEKEAIQLVAAEAWRHLARAHQDTDALATMQAAQKVADIAARYRRHEGIQYEAAQSWRHLSWAHKDTDALATAQAAQKVADIAARIDKEAFQFEAAYAWRLLAWAYHDTDALATEEATQKVADIAARFEKNETIQFEAAHAWRVLAWSHKETNAQASGRAAQKVTDIAERFENNEGIQFEAAQAWYFATLAAVKFDDEVLITRAMNELNRLAGLGHVSNSLSDRPQTASGRILEQRQLAQIAVDAWRRTRGTGGAPAASDAM